MKSSQLRSPRSTTDTAFLNTLREWLADASEILLLIEYSRTAGNKSFELLRSFAVLSERLHELAPGTRVTGFRQPQLPMRGIVDVEFINDCLRLIPDGSEFLVVETIPRTEGQHTWLHHEAGETHANLKATLEDLRGSVVAAGEYPCALDRDSDIVSACVPDEDGVARLGVY